MILEVIAHLKQPPLRLPRIAGTEIDHRAVELENVGLFSTPLFEMGFDLLARPGKIAFVEGKPDIAHPVDVPRATAQHDQSQKTDSKQEIELTFRCINHDAS